MVIRDLMDILYPHAEYFAEATFYETRPLNSNAGGLTFNFAYVEPNTKAFTRIFANVIGEDENIAIKTIARLNFVTGKNYIRLPDKRLYLVTEVLADYNTASKQAMRILPAPIGIEHIIRMSYCKDDWNEE